MKTKIYRTTPVRNERMAEILFALRQSTGIKITEQAIHLVMQDEFFDRELYLEPKVRQRLIELSTVRGLLDK